MNKAMMGASNSNNNRSDTIDELDALKEENARLKSELDALLTRKKELLELKEKHGLGNSKVVETAKEKEEEALKKKTTTKKSGSTGDGSGSGEEKPKKSRKKKTAAASAGASEGEDASVKRSAV